MIFSAFLLYTFLPSPPHVFTSGNTNSLRHAFCLNERSTKESTAVKILNSFREQKTLMMMLTQCRIQWVFILIIFHFCLFLSYLLSVEATSVSCLLSFHTSSLMYFAFHFRLCYADHYTRSFFIIVMIVTYTVFWRIGPMYCYVGGGLLFLLPLYQVVKLHYSLQTKSVKDNEDGLSPGQQNQQTKHKYL